MMGGLNCDLFTFVRETLKARSGLDAFFLLSTPEIPERYKRRKQHMLTQKYLWGIPKPFRFLSRLERGIESLSCRNMNIFAWKDQNCRKIEVCANKCQDIIYLKNVISIHVIGKETVRMPTLHSTCCSIPSNSCRRWWIYTLQNRKQNHQAY